MNIQPRLFLNRFVLVALILTGLGGCEPVPKDQAHFSKGFAAYEKGDFYTALLYLKPLVEEGNPAAQLLMAKMYANGQGVEEDMGKSELLRNLAAVKIYSHPHAPGTLRPANETLKAVSDRLDFLTGSDQSKGAKDLSQLLSSLDLGSLKQLGSATSEDPTEAAPTPASEFESESVQIPIEPPQVPAEAAPSPEPVTPETSPLPSEPAPLNLQGIRGTDQISLTMLQEAAEKGDPFAMKLLSAAYAKGFYGLVPNPIQAARWRQKALDAPNAANDEGETDRMPSGPVLGLMGGGVLLMGLGIWRFWVWGRKRT